MEVKFFCCTLTRCISILLFLSKMQIIQTIRTHIDSPFHLIWSIVSYVKSLTFPCIHGSNYIIINQYATGIGCGHRTCVNWLYLLYSKISITSRLFCCISQNQRAQQYTTLVVVDWFSPIQQKHFFFFLI